MAEFKHPINEKVSELQSMITRLTGRFDIINIDVHSVLDSQESTTKPCSWHYWMNTYLDLVNELITAGIVEEPKNSGLWDEYKANKGVIL